MPPKPRFTREAIIEAALKLVSEKGVEHLTARELADALDCSPQPIFTVFEDMADLKAAVQQAASQKLEAFTAAPMGKTAPAFKQTGMQIVLFAMQEPNLYKLAFSTEGKTKTFDEVFTEHGGAPDGFVAYITNAYGLSAEQARALFQHTWIFTFGLGMLCANGACTFTTEEVSQKLTENFLSTLMFMKAGGLNVDASIPGAMGQPPQA